MEEQIKITNFISTVEISLREDFEINDEKDFRRYIEGANESTNMKIKVCLFIFKWAEECKGTLENVFHDRANRSLVLEFQFETLEQISIFTQDLKPKVREWLTA